MAEKDTKPKKPVKTKSEEKSATAKRAEKSEKTSSKTVKQTEPVKQDKKSPFSFITDGWSKMTGKITDLWHNAVNGVKGGFSGALTAVKTFFTPKRIAIVSAATVGLICLIVGIVLGVSNCSPAFKYDDLDDIITIASYQKSHKNTTQVGYSAEHLGTVTRYKPVEGVHNEGLDAYPTYGSTLRGVIGTASDKVAARQALIRENGYLCCQSTSNGGGSSSPYYYMDKDGYLYQKNGEPSLDSSGNKRQLYKHTGSVGLYLGDVSDTEPAVIKQMTFRPRTYGSYYNVTGLYAPAGEVIKIEMTKEDFEATGGITVHIGQALYNGQANNIWAAKNQMQRMPVILNTMVVDNTSATFDEDTGIYTAYVGSFLGGPIYIRSESVTFSVRISGGVNYQHFILGVTTEDEYKVYSKSSAPYFDLEVWDSGVLHSGPKRYAQNYSYNDIHKAAILWEKISLVTTRVSNQGIVFLYDPFVAAGAAVAFPGRRSVNCPMGWMTSSLNYNSFVTSGAWGNMHEYHHNFQNYGVGDRGEVTNNGLNLVAYSLFTKISSARQIPGYGGAGLSGWNQYTSATWALQRVKQGGDSIKSTNGLAVYATLLHNLGQDAYIKSTGASGAAYFNKWANNTHQNFSYYANLISSYGGNLTLAENDYPMFVPVSSVYQTGRSYNYDGEKRYIETMQPYVIPYGEEFEVDLSPYTVNAANQYESGSVVIPNGFTYKIKNIDTSELNGTLTKLIENDETHKYTYLFKPNTELRSGKIKVTLEITNESNTVNGEKFAVDDVDLLIEFQQSHETKKSILERTVYSFDGEKKYTSATEAYKANYAGNSGVVEKDNINISQNSNTDVWLRPQADQYLNDPTQLPFVVVDNQVFEIRGKLYFAEAGKYRIYLRGRIDCALYLSRDGGKTYGDEPAAYINTEVSTSNTSNFLTDKPQTYTDVEVNAEEWIYFKEVLVTQQIYNKNGTKTGMASYVGLGIGNWTVPTYTTRVKYYDAEGNEVSEDSEDIVRSETLYFNDYGQQVTPEEASNAEPISPTSVTYATAYRQSYEFSKEFTSEYFYKRNYNYNFVGKTEVLTKTHTQTYMETIGNYQPWNNDGTQKLEHLFDGDESTNIHFSKNWGVSDRKPAILAFDMGETVKANSLTLYMYSAGLGERAFPSVFSLHGSLDGETWFEMGRWSGISSAKHSGQPLSFTDAEFRYYKLIITASISNYNARVALSGMDLSYTQRINGNGNNHISPDNEMFSYSGDWQVAQTNSSFGHVYVGKNNASAEFEFTGTRFAILSSKHYGKNYEVYIDGKKVESIDLLESSADFSIAFMSERLDNGKHKVIIKCVGEANIDSIATYTET